MRSQEDVGKLSDVWTMADPPGENLQSAVIFLVLGEASLQLLSQRR